MAEEEKANMQEIGALKDDWGLRGETIAQKVIAAHCRADVVSRTVGEREVEDWKDCE